MKKEGKPELIRRVGIRDVQNQNAVERLHGTLKGRLKPARGLKGEEKVRTLLEGWTVHYNYVRKHQTLKGKTPAHASGIDMKNDWNVLVKEATIYNTRKAKKDFAEEKPLEVMIE